MDWLDLIAELLAIARQLESEWPAELPPADSLEMWWRAVQLEPESRPALDAHLERCLTTGEWNATTPLLRWFLHKRLEWAGQLVELKAAGPPLPPEVPREELLAWALIQTWQTDGAATFRRRALERQPGG